MTTPQVQPFFHNASNTFTYVVADDASGRAAIVDPVLDFDAAAARTGTGAADAAIAYVRERGYAIDWILETHAHTDHLSGAVHVQAALGGRIAIGAGIAQVQQHFAPLFGLGAEATGGAPFDHCWQEGEVFLIGGIAARVIAVPGHTADGVAYLIGDALFTGDSLFMPDGGTARCDFPGGDASILYRSIQKLFELPDATRVFVCHDYGPGGREVRCETTIGEQKRGNIHVRDGIGEAAFVATREARDATLAVPALLLPALQVNLRAGRLPAADGNGMRFLVLPIDSI